MRLTAKFKGEKWTFASDLGVKTIAEIINAVFGILTFGILSRTLPKGDYAVVNQFIALGALITPIILFKFNSAFCVFLSSEKDKSVLKSRFFTSLSISAILMVVFCFLMVLGNSLLSKLMFDSEQYKDVVNVMGVYFSLLSISELSQSFFRAIKHMKKTSTLLIIKTALICVSFFAYVSMSDHFSLTNVVLIYTCIELVMASVSIILVAVFLRGVPMKWEFHALKEYYRYSLPLMPYLVMSWINTFVGRFIVTHLMNLEESGVYSFNSSMVTRAFFLSMALSYTIFPYVSKFWNLGQKDKVVLYLEKAFNISFYFGFPIMFGLVATAPTIVGILSGGNYDVQPLLIIILALGLIFQLMYAISSNLIDLSRKTVWYNIIFLITSLINVGLNYLLIPMMGINGAALALLVNYILQFALTLIVGSRSAGLRVRISLKHALVYVGTSVVMYFLTTLIYHNSGILNFAVTVIVGALFYFAATFGISKLFKFKLF